MIDGIIKGTGNSRMLKSAIAEATTWEQFRTALIAGTLPIDLAGINSEGWQQLATALSKGTLLADETAAALGLTGDPTVNDALNKLAATLPSKLIASYEVAGTYAWTVPDGVTKVTVAMIGGGGSGAAGAREASITGGASGVADIIEDYDVIPGNVIPIVVGAGGKAVSASGSYTTSAKTAGNNGGSTSFDGVAVAGGDGGTYTTAGVRGGQFAAPLSFFPSVLANYEKAALYSGRIVATYAANGISGASLSPTAFDKMRALGILPFCLCAGNPVVTAGNVTSNTGPLTLPNGKSSGYSQYAYSTGYTSATAGKGTDPGCGGAGAAGGSSSGNISATSAAGCDGGVFIYVKEGQ